MRLLHVFRRLHKVVFMHLPGCQFPLYSEKFSQEKEYACLLSILSF